MQSLLLRHMFSVLPSTVPILVAVGVATAAFPTTLPAQPPAASASQGNLTALTNSEPKPHPLPPLKPPTIHATSAILVDAVSGQVLYEKNADARRPMASTTKIMTALVFCEHVPDDAIITATPDACAVRESSLHLKVGEKLTSHDLLRAILMRSANDGCVDAADYVAGSESTFVDMMNARAASLGATNTHFANPHGLHSIDHYTTARDLAAIARAAMQEARIREVVSCKRCRISRSINKRDVTLTNHSHFLGHFPGADGVKTGWTIPAGHCYVGSATQKNWRLISVVLNSPNYVAETAELMKFGYSNFTPHLVAKAGDQAGICTVRNGDRTTIPVKVKSPVQVVLRKGDTSPVESETEIDTADAPLASGASIGAIHARVNGKVVCSSPLLAAESSLLPPEPIALTSDHGSYSGRFLILVAVSAAGLVSLRYGTRISTFTKGARRRRRRLKKSM